MIAVLHLMLSCVDLSSTRIFLGAGDVACSSVAEGLPGRHEAVAPIPSTKQTWLCLPVATSALGM